MNVIIHSRMHDDACIVSAEFELDTNDSGLLIKTLESEMESVSAWAEQAGAIIGHIKAYIKPCESSVMLSTVGKAVDVKGEISYDVGITGIMFMTELIIAEQVISDISIKTIKNVLGNVDTSIEKCDGEHGHSHEHSSSHSHHTHGHEH